MGHIWIQNTLCSQDTKTSTGEIISPPKFPGKMMVPEPQDGAGAQGSLWAWPSAPSLATGAAQEAHPAPGSSITPDLWAGPRLTRNFPCILFHGMRFFWVFFLTKSKPQSLPQRCCGDHKPCSRPFQRGLLKFAESIVAWKSRDKRKTLPLGELRKTFPTGSSSPSRSPQVWDRN